LLDEISNLNDICHTCCIKLEDSEIDCDFSVVCTLECGHKVHRQCLIETFDLNPNDCTCTYQDCGKNISDQDLKIHLGE